MKSVTLVYLLDAVQEAGTLAAHRPRTSGNDPAQAISTVDNIRQDLMPTNRNRVRDLTSSSPGATRLV